MNVLWDMRLFSTGYRNRGIGRYCFEVARSMLAKHPDCSIFLWGAPHRLPPELHTPPVTIIPYHSGTWKTSVFRLPFLVLNYRINLLHYWVALGPLSSVGITPFPLVPTVATIHDLGVELWDTPHARFVRRTPYWRLQRRFMTTVSAIMTNSITTYGDIDATLPLSGKPHITAYPPFPSSGSRPVPASGRKPYLIALGGAPHKNLFRIITAFTQVRAVRPEIRLILLGDTDSAEHLPIPLPAGIIREPSMERSIMHLRQCGGLVFCSLHEGLGLPPIEAMVHGCPLLLSDIPSLRETCGSSARFVDPLSVESITGGMSDILEHSDAWCRKAAEGAKTYTGMSNDTPERIFHLYKEITGLPVRHDT